MKPTPEQINDNFFGKPNKVTIKGKDGNDYDFEFQQFGMEDAFNFIKFADKFMKYGKVLEEKKKTAEFEITDLNPELMTEAIPWVEKMVSMSYSDWTKEQVRQFCNSNFMFLLNIVIYTNLTALINSNQNINEDLNRFVEEERKKKEALKVG